MYLGEVAPDLWRPSADGAVHGCCLIRWSAIRLIGAFTREVVDRPICARKAAAGIARPHSAQRLASHCAVAAQLAAAGASGNGLHGMQSQCSCLQRRAR